MAVELVKLPLKGDGPEKRGGETKILKGGASWVKGWVPYRGGGAGSPLRTIKGKTPSVLVVLALIFSAANVKISHSLHVRVATRILLFN